MPTVSEAQRKLMEGVAHNPDFAKKIGISQSVGKEFVGKDGKKAEDMTDEEWNELSSAFSKWIKEEKNEPEHASDQLLALDLASSRRIDEDGRLHVFPTNISKANICPYRGSEIPASESLGLDPNKIYMLLRDPSELERAASTFNNIPLLTKHVPVSVDDPNPHLVVGSTGTDAAFSDPYLINSLVVWDAGAIAGIEHNLQKELSCAYRYDADMVPGEYAGTKYDGVMRNIRGNHVALVESGRAGSDVVVGDEQLGIFIMPLKKRQSIKAVAALGAITGFVAPRLAQDSKFDATSVRAILADTNAENWIKQKPRLATALHTGLSALKLAKDASLEDIHCLLDSLDNEPGMAGDMEEEDDKKKAEDEEDDDDKKKKEAEDEEEDDDKKKKEEKKAEDGEETAVMDKKAMDAAIAKAVSKGVKDAEAKFTARHEAEKFVRPLVGEISGMDSADEIYKYALDQGGVDLTGVHPSAYRAMTQMLISQKSAAPRDSEMASDASSMAGLDKWVPDSKRITSF